MSQEVGTIAELFYRGLDRQLPDAMAIKQGEGFTPISHAQVQAQVERLALALAGRGYGFGTHVAILAENSPEWAYTDYACAILGLPLTTIYATLNAPQAGFILRDSASALVICSTVAQLEKVLENWPTLPDLRAAVLLRGEIPAAAAGRAVATWAELMKEGEAQEARRPEVRQWALERTPEDLLTLIYTSGTTADPKGAMLTHGNVVSNVIASVSVLPLIEGDRCLSFLPLTHIFERMAGHYCMWHIGSSIYYAESVNTVAADLMVAKPTVLCSVPRIYEKIYARIQDSVAGGSLVKRLIFKWAMNVGREAVPNLYADKPVTGWLGFKFRLAKKLVFDKILARTGGRIRFACSGGAPLSAKLMEFFWIVGLPILEGYGLTETSPVICVNKPGAVGPGTVGHPLYDLWNGRPFMKIAEDGEVLCQGPNVMRGYWRNEKATQEAIDADGYFHTGDIGSLDDQGRLRITDRKKELIVTSGGKKIAPQPIENLLKTDKYISQAVLIGDQRNFITALIVPNFDSLERWAGYKKLHYAHHRELTALPLVMAKLMSRVEKVNATLSGYERIKKIAIIHHEMTVETGELTPSL
ncbi:MAG TPA: long-chain fatty acid--CoA ligase, partial [Holophagaceae bacterium]|nr:long-chain fatty acid--CoA ligase [Holophagaceae bacterium]